MHRQYGRERAEANYRQARRAVAGFFEKLNHHDAFDDPAVPALGKEPVFAIGGATALGYLTSAGYGPSVGLSLAYAYLPVEQSAVGTPLEVYSFGVRHGAHVVAEPVYDPGSARLRA